LGQPRPHYWQGNTEKTPGARRVTRRHEHRLAARILLDQVRCVDKARLDKKWGKLIKPPGTAFCWKFWLDF
jgi:hypothetical protein